MGERKNVSLIEVLVLILVGTLLLALFGPHWHGPARELAKRSVCAANLFGNAKALAMYANSYRGSFPLVTAARMRDSGSPETGLQPRPDEGTVLMFDGVRTVAGQASNQVHRWQGLVDASSPVAPAYPFVRVADKNVSYAFPSRELWLLVKGNYSQTNQFVCPSSAHDADDLRADRLSSAQHVTDVKRVLNLRDETEVVAAVRLWDFLEPDTLDYGYMFAHDANGEQAKETTIDPQYPVMADSNPYIRMGLYGEQVTPGPIARNSPNHLAEGQNVLFGDLHAQFCDKPTVGVGGDNIYTSWFSRPGQNGSADMPGIAPQALGGGAGELPTNYHFDIVSRTDAMLLP